MIIVNLENKNAETIINELNKTFTSNGIKTVTEIEKNKNYEKYEISNDKRLGDLFYLDYVYYDISEKELTIDILRKYYYIPNNIGMDCVTITEWEYNIFETLTDLGIKKHEIQVLIDDFDKCKTIEQITKEAYDFYIDGYDVSIYKQNIVEKLIKYINDSLAEEEIDNNNPSYEELYEEMEYETIGCDYKGDIIEGCFYNSEGKYKQVDLTVYDVEFFNQINNIFEDDDTTYEINTKNKDLRMMTITNMIEFKFIIDEYLYIQIINGLLK